MKFVSILMAIAALTVLPAQATPLQFDDVSRMADDDAQVIFKGMRVDAYIPNAALTDTIRHFMSIPGGDTPVRFGHFAMIEGCRLHSCIEKAAIVVDIDTRKVVAVALRNYQCSKVALGDGKNTRVRCNDEPILDLYAVRSTTQAPDLQGEGDYLGQLRQWGKTVGHQGERLQVVNRKQARTGP